MLLSHNTYSSDITTDRIQYFVREISKKLDVGAHLWRNDAGWMLALNNSLLPSQNFFTKGFVFSDPQSWGILGLTDKQIHVLYSCVHCILLTGAKDFDEWKRKVEVDVNLAHDEFVLGANNLFYFCLKIIIVLFVLWFGLNFITHHKNYPEKKAEVETWLGFRTVTPTPNAIAPVK